MSIERSECGVTRDRRRQLYEEISRQVVAEELERETDYTTWFLEENKRRMEVEEKERQLLLKEMQYPLYKTQPYTLYAEKYGSSKLHPFHKDTRFSKPIKEEMNQQFK